MTVVLGEHRARVGGRGIVREFQQRLTDPGVRPGPTGRVEERRLYVEEIHRRGHVLALRQARTRHH